MNLILIDLKTNASAGPTTNSTNDPLTQQQQPANNTQNDNNDNEQDFPPQNVYLRPSDPGAKHIHKHLLKTKKLQGDNNECRVRIGFLPGGPIGQAILPHNGRRADGSVHLKIVRHTLRPPPWRPRLRILLGVPFPKVVKQLWAVLTSFMVEHILYMSAALTEPEYLNTSALTPVGYEPLIREGLAQAEDTLAPNIHILKATIQQALTPSKEEQEEEECTTTYAKKILKDASDGCSKILLHIGDYPSIRQCYLHNAIICENSANSNTTSTNNTAKYGGILLAVGPERGWTDEEVEAFEKANFQVASLGSPILKTETAVVAGVALARDVLLEPQSLLARDKHTDKHDASNDTTI